MTDQPRLLILGGTGEARELARALTEQGDFHVISSLAGRVRNPALPAGEVHIGGFGGADGLANYLRAERITAVVDATHPFAGAISANAVRATHTAGLDLLLLRRPVWSPEPGDDWLRVPTIEAAAAAVRERTQPGASVLLTTGRRDLSAFASDVERHYVIRSVDEPRTALPLRHTLVLDRGPYDLDGELALFHRHDIAALVSKDSGGAMTYPKLAAARALGRPVILVERPPRPVGDYDCVETVSAALTWATARHSRP